MLLSGLAISREFSFSCEKGLKVLFVITIFPSEKREGRKEEKEKEEVKR